MKNVTEAPNIGVAQTIIQHIRAIVEEQKIGVIEAAVIYSESSGFDIEFLGDVIKTDGLLKSMIEEEAEKLHFIKPTSRLELE